MKINYDRGVLKKQDPNTGAEVFMYKDSPGVFLNAFEVEVALPLAKAAGFDVDRLVKEREKRDRLRAAALAIEAEYESVGVKHEVVRENKGFKVVDIGAGRYNVEDPDGGKLNTMPLPEDIANRLLDQLAPPDQKPAKGKGKPAPAPADEPKAADAP